MGDSGKKRPLPRGQPEDARPQLHQEPPLSTRNKTLVIKNVGSLHRLLNFAEDPAQRQRIARLLAKPPGRRSGGSKPETMSQDPTTNAPCADALKRARHWRAKAEECRTAGESMKNETARNALFNLAHSYEALAENLEEGGRQSGRKNRDAG
jgi:hypothetical protein